LSRGFEQVEQVYEGKEAERVHVKVYVNGQEGERGQAELYIE
jgi:hypothetical protein